MGSRGRAATRLEFQAHVRADRIFLCAVTRRPCGAARGLGGRRRARWPCWASENGRTRRSERQLVMSTPLEFPSPADLLPLGGHTRAAVADLTRPTPTPTLAAIDGVRLRVDRDGADATTIRGGTQERARGAL